MNSLTRREFAGAVLGFASRARAIAAAAPIDETLRKGIAERKIPAAVGMAADADKVLYAGAFGVRDASGVPVTVNSIFQIASMTKAVTTVAALQLVEQGKIRLDEPVSRLLPQLAGPKVLDHFDAGEKPVLRLARTQITLKHLLTHTSGLCYDTWDGDMYRYTKAIGPSANGAAAPVLMFEPGARWQYGTGVDFAGRLVETISGMSLEDYFQAKIFRPLGMADTSFIVPESKFDRLVTRYERQADGMLKSTARSLPAVPRQFNGGGGLYSTAADYVQFMQMILKKGGGILKGATVESMEINQIGSATAGKMKSYQPERSSDVDIQPGATEKWGLGFLINTTAYTGGRSAGSLAWAGLYNTFFWIDPQRARCAVLLMQFLPFVDRAAIGLLGDFERAVYAAG
jgi:CubicO group peptidase (beta-lactamase class C family)